LCKRQERLISFDLDVALVRASFNNHTSMIKALLSFGADPNQCSQPSRPTAVPGSPSEISPGRTDGAKAVRLRPSSRRTECRPSSTVIGRLLYIFRLNPIKPDNVIQASECMKSWVQRV
jgi:ankyrin repeat protein